MVWRAVGWNRARGIGDTRIIVRRSSQREMDAVEHGRLTRQPHCGQGHAQLFRPVGAGNRPTTSRDEILVAFELSRIVTSGVSPAKSWGYTLESAAQRSCSAFIEERPRYRHRRLPAVHWRSCSAAIAELPAPVLQAARQLAGATGVSGVSASACDWVSRAGAGGGAACAATAAMVMGAVGTGAAIHRWAIPQRRKHRGRLLRSPPFSARRSAS